MSDETEQEVEFSDGERARGWLADAVRNKPMSTAKHGSIPPGSYAVRAALSDTPRTDAREERNGNVLCGAANLDFARTLERELAAAQARIASLEETLRVVNVEAALAGEEKARLDARLARLHDDYAESMRIKESEIVRLSGLVKKLEENQCEQANPRRDRLDRYVCAALTGLLLRNVDGDEKDYARWAVEYAKAALEAADKEKE